MPILPEGLYSADVAVADGTPSEHLQLQWIHDAFRLESRAASTSTGLIGIPFGKIEVHKVHHRGKPVSFVMENPVRGSS